MFSKIIITQLPKMMNKKCADTAQFVSKIFEDSKVAVNREKSELFIIHGKNEMVEQYINTWKQNVLSGTYREFSGGLDFSIVNHMFEGILIDNVTKNVSLLRPLLPAISNNTSDCCTRFTYREYYSDTVTAYVYENYDKKLAEMFKK